MSVTLALAAGIVQGLTEFLPISSSGHLALIIHLFGPQPASGQSLGFSVMVHLATLGAVCAYYFRDIVALATRRRALLVPLLLGCLPAGVVGVAVKLLFEEQFARIESSPSAVGVFLIATGLFLYVSSRRCSASKDIAAILGRDALIIGLAQAVAVLPGISRSGSTIAAAALLGVRFEDAAKFSFLMAVPLIAGAGMLEARHISELAILDPMPAAAGAGAAFLSALAAIAVLVRLLRRGKLYYFTPYLLAVGGVALIAGLMR